MCRVAKILLTLFLDKGGGSLSERASFVETKCKKGRRKKRLPFSGQVVVKRPFPELACAPLALRAQSGAVNFPGSCFAFVRRKPAGIMLCLGPISQTRPPPRVHIRSTLPFKTIMLVSECVCHWQINPATRAKMHSWSRLSEPPFFSGQDLASSSLNTHSARCSLRAAAEFY